MFRSSVSWANELALTKASAMTLQRARICKCLASISRGWTLPKSNLFLTTSRKHQRILDGETRRAYQKAGSRRDRIGPHPQFQEGKGKARCRYPRRRTGEDVFRDCRGPRQEPGAQHDHGPHYAGRWPDSEVA